MSPFFHHPGSEGKACMATLADPARTLN